MPAEYQLDDKKNVNRPERKTAVSPQSAEPLTRDQIEHRLDSGTVTQMQQTLGNTAVQRLLAQRSSDGGGEVDEETAASINRQRGSGGSLDGDIAQKAGQTMGQDFSGVTVHTDAQADQLSRQLGAEAFTTGSDVFFRAGAYDPASSDGQHLIAHELTHVVQQGASAPNVQGKLTVNDPNDQFEAQADSVADMVMNQPVEEEEELQMQEVEEEEEIQMQELPEEEELEL
ncbi:MAG: DUF4157 domain-containing protein [Ardenticatenaceae bacterium]|nr:DUF4157 domain-containing protein [Ardenticatenaceae bacterium]MCB8986358.1 DUF4157 domain-containing protein [Ardenticatenaceae bacterium]